MISLSSIGDRRGEIDGSWLRRSSRSIACLIRTEEEEGKKARGDGLVVGWTAEEQRTVQEGGLRHPGLPLQEQLQPREVPDRFFLLFSFLFLLFFLTLPIDFCYLLSDAQRETIDSYPVLDSCSSSCLQTPGNSHYRNPIN